MAPTSLRSMSPSPSWSPKGSGATSDTASISGETSPRKETTFTPLVILMTSKPGRFAGTPVVGLYGPKDPRVYRPWTPRQRLLRVAVPCSPCTLRQCTHSICMQLIAPRAVASGVLDLLEEVEGQPIVNA